LSFLSIKQEKGWVKIFVLMLEGFGLIPWWKNEKGASQKTHKMALS